MMKWMINMVKDTSSQSNVVIAESDKEHSDNENMNFSQKNQEHQDGRGAEHTSSDDEEPCLMDTNERMDGDSMYELLHLCFGILNL